MTQIFGKFIERQEEYGEYLKIGFSPTSIPIQQRWRNNGLSADFLADYVYMFFPREDGTSSERQAEMKGVISYIANELLENAMKFSYAPSQHAISLAMYLEADAISLYDWQPETPVCLVFGHEKDGVAAHVAGAIGTHVRIPMFGTKRSLNVATAAGVALYELLRQELLKTSD